MDGTCDIDFSQEEKSNKILRDEKVIELEGTRDELGAYNCGTLFRSGEFNCWKIFPSWRLGKRGRQYCDVDILTLVLNVQKLHVIQDS